MASLENFDSTTWVGANGFDGLSDFDLYVKAAYLTVTVITTVGFGDITA